MSPRGSTEGRAAPSPVLYQPLPLVLSRQRQHSAQLTSFKPQGFAFNTFQLNLEGVDRLRDPTLGTWECEMPLCVTGLGNCDMCKAGPHFGVGIKDIAPPEAFC